MFVQLYNFSYPSGSNRSAVPNGIFCIVCLLVVFALPIGSYLYLNYKFCNMEYSDYFYWYEDIFFQRLPTQSLPSNSHTIHILITNIRYILLAICFAYLGYYPIAASLLILLLHALNLFYTRFFNI